MQWWRKRPSCWQVSCPMHKLIYRGFSSFLIWRIHLPHLINIHSGSFLWALNCIIKTERVKTNLIFFLKMILVHIFQSSSLFFPCTRSCSKYDFFYVFLPVHFQFCSWHFFLYLHSFYMSLPGFILYFAPVFMKISTCRSFFMIYHLPSAAAAPTKAKHDGTWGQDTHLI